MKRFVLVCLAAACVSALVSPAAPAQDATPKTGCDSFKWDVSHELAVLAQPAKALDAARDAKSPVRAELDTHYAVKLAPQGSVRFTAKPNKADEGAHGGLLLFHVPKPGRYRVSITTGHWIDIVDGKNLVVSRDFQGHTECEKVHKIVEFELSGNKDFTLQLSGTADASVGLAITQVGKAG
jgi:hypothetical protein